MSENQQAPETTDIEYTNKDGIQFDLRIPGKLNDEEIKAYLEKAVPEIEMAEGLREPGFGFLTMGAVPTESFEQGLYGARQVGATLGAELGLLGEDTAAEDIAKMERYKEYSREQARREDFASGDVVGVMNGREVREGELEYYRDQETLQNLAKAETFSDAISTLADNPTAVLPIIGESLGMFAPALVGTAAVGIATGGTGVPGIIATALTGGLGSGATEYGASFLQSFSENGVDVSDDEQVLAALNDESTLDSIREDAAKRGIAIGAFDAATVGFAGKLTSLIKGAPLSKAAAEASALRRVGAGTAEAGAQAVGGGGGEAAAQALTGEYKPGEIVLEAVAEMPTALPEVALGARAGRTRRLRKALEERGYTDEQMEQFGSMSGNQQNKIIKELNETNTSTTFPSQRQMDIEAESVSERQADIEVDTVSVRGVSDTGEEVQRTVPAVEVGRSAEASEFAETTLLEDLYGDTIEEVDTVAEVATPTSPREKVEFLRSELNFNDEEIAEFQEKSVPDQNKQISREVSKVNSNKSIAAAPVSADTEARFTALGEAQRGLPERKMEAVQFTTGGGVLSFVVEHVGDLTHRMSEKFTFLNGNIEDVKDKVDKTLASLEPMIGRIGFEQEHQQNLEAGHRSRVLKENPNLTFEEHKAEVDQSLSEYADEHAKLTTYNRPQYLAREAAVALGRQDFDRARFMLNTLKNLVDNPSEYAVAVRQDFSQQKPEHNFVQKSPTQEELELARSSTSTDLKQDEMFVSLLKGEAAAAGVPEDQITQAVDSRINNLIREAAEEDHSTSDPDSMAGRTSDGRLIRSEEEAIQFTGNQLAESNGPVTPVLADKPLSQGEYNQYAAKTPRDLNWFARWWNFPDVMAERYPAFAPYWNAVNLQRQVTAFKLTDYMSPMANPLKKLKSEDSQIGVAQALELLDQMRTTALEQYGNEQTKKLDPAKMRDPANPNQYLLKNKGGADVNTALTKDGDTIILDQDQMDALLAIRESFDKAKADIITAYNSNFYFGPQTTVPALTSLVNELKSYTNQADKAALEGNVTVSTENQDAALQAIKDSPLINTADPESIFNTETDPAKLITYINNYKNTLAVYAANPFYFPHSRFGTIAFTVTQMVDGKKENVWVETHKPQDFKKNLLTADFSQIGTTKKYKEIMARLQEEYRGPVYTVNPPVDFERAFNEYTENPTADGIHELLSRVAEVQMESLTPEQNDAVTQFLTKARNTLLTNQASSVDPAKLVQRLNIKGWISPSNSVDQMNQTINVYMGKAAGYVANEATKRQRAEAIRQLDAPTGGQRRFRKLAEYARELEDYMNGGYRDVGHLKRISFHYFLGLNPSSAVVNLTQIPMATIPWLIRFSPSTSAQLEVMRAMKDAGKVAGLIKGIKRTGTATVNEVLKLDYPLGKSVEARQLWDDMKIDLQNNRLMSQVTAEQAGLVNYGQFQAGKSVIRNAENISASIFSYVELINRMSTYIAAHRTYTKAQKKGKIGEILRKLETNADYTAMQAMPDYQGSSEARKFAAFSVDKTQFLMGADNRPKFMRGAIPSVVFQFMQFPVRYLQLIDSLVFREGGIVKNPKERAAALAYMATFMIMTGGFWSLPLAENAVDLGEFVYKKLYQTDPMIKAELDKALFRMGMDDPSYFTRGVIPQLANLSLTGRTGAGRLIQPDMLSGDFSKTIGPAGSMIFGSAAGAIQAAHNDDYYLAFANAMPTAAYNFMKAIRMGLTGQVKTARQNRVMMADEISMRQVVPQILGFQPEDVSQQMLYEYNVRRRNTRVSELQTSFGNRIKSKLADGYRSKRLYDQSVARNAPAPILLQESKEAFREAAKYMEEMKNYNLETEDPALRLNLTGATFRSWSKNAVERAGGRPKLGRKVARQTEMQDRFEMAPYPQKLKMLRDGYVPIRY